MGVNMNNRASTASCLAKSLNKALLNKFGKIPSASVFANQFNLRAYGTKTITRETARKWLLGLAVPEIDKLVVLIEWLDLDVDGLFETQRKKIKAKNSTLKDDPKGIDHHIINCLNQLNSHSKNALFMAAWLLKELQKSNYQISLCEKIISDQLNECSKCNSKTT